jgi:hypothetical protein
VRHFGFYLYDLASATKEKAYDVGSSRKNLHKAIADLRKTVGWPTEGNIGHDILFFWQLPVGMFKTKVQENAFFSAARSHSNGHGDAWNNLKPVFEIVGPANSRAE